MSRRRELREKAGDFCLWGACLGRKLAIQGGAQAALWYPRGHPKITNLALSTGGHVQGDFLQPAELGRWESKTPVKSQNNKG